MTNLQANAKLVELTLKMTSVTLDLHALLCEMLLEEKEDRAKERIQEAMAYCTDVPHNMKCFRQKIAGESF